MRFAQISALVTGLALVLGSPGASGAEAPFGWQVGPTAWTFNRFTLFEAIDKTASVELGYIEAFEGQRVRPDADLKLDAALSDEAIQAIRAKLDACRVKMPGIYIHTIPGEEAACRQTFEFARKLGVQYIVSEPAPESLNVIERCCDEFGINVAIHNHPEGKSRYWSPEEALKVCEGRGPRIGVCADTGHWLRSGLDPSESVRKLGKRLLTLHLKDLDRAAPDGTDRPWGQGCGELDQVLRTIRELGLTPALFGIEYESNWENNLPHVVECAAWFKKTVGALAAGEAQQADSGQQ